MIKMKGAIQIAIILSVVLLSLSTLTSATICVENANYTNQSSNCVCDPGYTGNPNISCYDIDECANGLSNCFDNLYCFNTNGSFSCICPLGYDGDGVNCTSQCSAPCNGPYEICVGVDTCGCDYGFNVSNSSGLCEDINECLTVQCAENAQCINSIGSYRCECNPGYEGDGNFFCYDSCFSNPCGPYADCFTNNGSLYCLCRDGFTGNGYDCQPLAQCPPCGGNAECQFSAEMGYYQCECQDGYEGDPYTNCTDVDECASEDYCESDGVISCYNTIGGFNCTCRCDYFFSSVIGDCIELERDEPVRAPPINIPGCNENFNLYAREEISYQVGAFLQEYLAAKDYADEANCDS